MYGIMIIPTAELVKLAHKAAELDATETEYAILMELQRRELLLARYDHQADVHAYEGAMA